MSFSKKLKEFLLYNVLIKCVFFLSYCICSTLRITIINSEAERKLLQEKKPYIAASWHGEFLLLPYLYRWQNKYNNLVSPSKDGEFIANFLQLWGMKVIRGSSYKAAREALYSMKSCIENGEYVFSIADGSRGPYHELQQGTPLLAKMTGSPLIFLSIDYSHKYVVPSWDKFKVPLPFSRAVVTYSDPIYIDKALTKEAFQRKVSEIQGEFRNLSQKNTDSL